LSATRELRQLQQQASLRFPTTQLAQQLRVDFTNARGMLVDAQGVTLHGFLGSNPRTTRPMMTPGRIRYQIARVADRNVLIRITPNSREPVWVGCSLLRVESMDQVGSEDELLPQPESGGLPNVPAKFRLILVGDDRQVLWQEMIHHHEE
jgi:hypothetical protein